MLAGHVLYAATPTITSFSPAQGHVGSLVTINGTNLGSPTAFSIGGKAAIVISNTGTQLVGLVMPGSITGVVSITASGATANSSTSFTITTNSPPNTQQGNPLVGTNGVGQPYQGNAVAISADGNTAVVGGYNDNSNTGAGWFYTRSGGVWTQQGAKVTGAGTSGGFGAYFGSSVAISADGNTAIFGGPDDNTGTGATWVFTRTAGVWTQQGNKLVGTGAIANNGNPKGNAQQGQSVSLSADGNTALVGGWFDNGGIGATWVFTRSGGVWTQQGNKLLGSTGAGNSYQGKAVALSADGNTALIGGPNDNAGQGALWFFTRSGGAWTQQGAKILGAGNTGAAAQGTSVALSADGNTAIEGGPGDESPLGAVWIFTRSGGAWAQQGSKLVGGGGFNYSYGSTEGSAVAMSADGNTAIIGGNTDGNDAGAIWIFTRSAGIWTQQGNKFNGTGSGSSSYGQQGSSTALSADGTTLIEGAPEANTNYGITYVFTPVLPTATTETATNITATGATLYGLFSANGISCNANLEYGTAPDLTGGTITTTFNQGSNPVTTDFDAITSAVTGLTPATVYYWRANATNVNGTTNGVIKSFTTGSAPPPPPPMITFPGPGNVVYGSITAPVISSTDPTQPFHYRIVNTAVASVTADNKFLAIGVGTSSIVAYQYAAGTTNIEAVTDGTITVTPAPLTAKADNKTVNFGQPIPPLTITYTGFVNGDTPASLTQQATATTPASQGTAAGQYNIFNGANAIDPNYSFTYADGTLTIVPILPDPTATTVAATNITPTGATLNGIANGEGASATITIQYTDDDGDGPEDYQFATLTTGPATLPAGSGNTNYAAIISGLLPNTTYYFIITAQNGEYTTTGNVLTFTTPPALNAQTITFGPLANEIYGSADVVLGATSTNTTIPITYTSSNTAVATIVGGKIHITGVGTTNITAMQAGNATYDAATPVIQPFTVTPAALTITPDHKTKVYGSANPPLTANYKGFVNGDTQNVLTTQPTISTTATSGSIVGIYQITAQNAVAANYTITYLADTLIITPAALTITPDNKTKVYGANNPVFTASYSGFVNGDSQGSLTTQPSIVAGVTDTTSVGTYPITASNAADANYTITYKTGTLTITQAALTITAANKTKVYGSANPVLTAIYGGFVNGDDSTKLTKQAIITTTATISSGVGNYSITASSATARNYSISYVPGNLKVTPEALTITANNQTKVVGSANPPLTLTYKSFVNGDTNNNLTTQPTITTTATTSSVAGTYPITVSGAVDANYTITYVNGTLTVSALLTLNPFPPKTYGDPDFDPGATGTDVTYTSGNTGVATIVSGNIHIVGAGTSVITVTSGGQSVQQTLTVNKAPLTITAADQTRTYGSANPVLTISYNKFVNGDTNNSLTTQPTITTTATTNSDVGTYPITASGAVSSNYSFTYVAGTLSITQATQTINFAAIPDQQLPATYDLSSVTASSNLPVTFTISDPTLAAISGTTLTSLKTGSVTITASQPGNNDYLAAASVQQTFNIREANNGNVVVEMVVSPNGDGINDVLRIINIENYPDNKFILINRNGVKIYETAGYDNVTKVFDGHSSITGALQQAGTYLYVLEYRVNGKLERKTGFTELRY